MDVVDIRPFQAHLASPSVSSADAAAFVDLSGCKPPDLPAEAFRWRCSKPSCNPQDAHENSSSSSSSTDSSPSKRPFAWAVAVSSLDGITSFAEPNAHGAKEVALAHVHKAKAGALADFCLLEAGWGTADAVLGGAATLRAEPELVAWAPSSSLQLAGDSNNAYDSSGTNRRLPMQVVLSRSGDIDPRHPLIAAAAAGLMQVSSGTAESVTGVGADVVERPRVIIATTEHGSAAVCRRFAELDLDLYSGLELEVFPYLSAFEDVSNEDADGVHLPSLCHRLWCHYNVQFLDVSAGGETIGAMVNAGLLDELRLTLVGQLIGPLSSSGQQRPRLFRPPMRPAVPSERPVAPDVEPSIEQLDSVPALNGRQEGPIYENPHVRFMKVRSFGDQHLFLRGAIMHRRRPVPIRSPVSARAESRSAPAGTCEKLQRGQRQYHNRKTEADVEHAGSLKLAIKELQSTLARFTANGIANARNCACLTALTSCDACEQAARHARSGSEVGRVEIETQLHSIRLQLNQLVDGIHSDSTAQLGLATSSAAGQPQKRLAASVLERERLKGTSAHAKRNRRR